MSAQPETIKIVNPFSEYLRYQGWHVKKTHGNQYTAGWPDLYCMHPSYTPRWVECKINYDGQIHVTPDQMAELPKWIAHGCYFWVIVGHDFRGLSGKAELHRAYQKLFGKPNGHLLFHPSTRRLLV